MKKATIILACLLFVSIIAGTYADIMQYNPINANSTVFTVSSSAPSIPLGESFTVNVTIEPDRAIAGAQLNLKFNSSLIIANSVQEGDFFKQNGSNTIFNSGIMDNTAGTISHVWGNILNTSDAPKNVSTAGTFAIINFSSYRPGSSSLSLFNLPPITILAAGSDGNPVPVNVTNATIEVIKYPRYDVNQDGIVDILDIIIVGQHFGESH